MAVKKEFVAVLERISKDVRSHSDALRVVTPELKHIPRVEDELIEVAAELFRCVFRLDAVVESIKDWNSRHDIPIP